MPQTPRLPAHERIALALPEAAAALDVSLDTLNAWIEAGQIPLTPLTTPAGKRLPRVMWDDLAAFCIQQRDPYPLPTVLRKRRSA